MPQRPLLLCLVLLATLAGAAPAQKSLASLLSSKKIEDRLDAIEQLQGGSVDRAEARLQRLLGDRDWEVIEAAINALAEVGTKKSTDKLVKLAAKAPIRRLRLAASRALGRLDPEKGASKLAKKVTKKNAEMVSDALARIGGKKAGELLLRMIKSKEPLVQKLGYLGLGSGGGPEHFELFSEMLGRSDLMVRLAGLRGLARSGKIEAAPLLLAHLEEARLSDVEKRRVRFAFRDMVRGLPAGAARTAALEELVQHLRRGTSAPQTRQFMILLGELGSGRSPAAPKDRCEDILLQVGTNSRSQIVRATALAALEDIGSDRGADRAVKLATDDPSDVTRFHALGVAVRMKGKGWVDALKRGIKDRALPVREEAAALAGRHAVAEMAQPLLTALGDESWEVALAATISLGRLRDETALPALQKLAKHRDWKLRGGAALALGWLRTAEATDALLPLLDDRDPSVETTAWWSLRRITGHDAPAHLAKWKEWWRKQRDGFDFKDAKKAADEARAAGYAASDYGVYKDIDVVVLVTREGGDNIQLLLERIGIEHRRTKVGAVKEAALHPFAIFVANCPGEIQDADVERVQWFVRSGGYLFSSCWALTHTIEKSVRGIVTMHRTSQQVMDVVEAEAVNPANPLVRSVFRPGTRAQYVLEGSHIISVIDPVRFEVLVDSPACAARWGEGNMAGFFTLGHGLIFDSANHFDLQGMKRGETPKTATGRRAFAMDRLGYDHREVRDLDKRGVFKTATLAARKLEDLSMFRMITNFVRSKRRAEL